MFRPYLSSKSVLDFFKIVILVFGCSMQPLFADISSTLVHLRSALISLQGKLHEFDKGQVESLIWSVDHVQKLIGQFNYGHLEVTNGFILMTNRFHYSEDFFRFIEKEDIREELSVIQHIVASVRTEIGLGEKDVGTKIVKTNLLELSATFKELLKLKSVRDQPTLADVIIELNGITIRALPKATLRDSREAFDAGEKVYIAIVNSYSKLKKVHADQRSATLVGAILNINESMGRFCQARVVLPQTEDDVE